MTTQELPKLNAEELLQAAAGNFNGLMFVTFDFLKQHQILIQEYSQFVGKRFAEMWTPGMSAYQLAKSMAVNLVSCGAKLEELAGDEIISRLVVSGWPPTDLMEGFSARLGDALQFMELVQPIAERQNCALELQQQDGQIVFLFTRKA